jgi:hypothetical protein
MLHDVSSIGLFMAHPMMEWAYFCLLLIFETSIFGHPNNSIGFVHGVKYQFIPIFEIPFRIWPIIEISQYVFDGIHLFGCETFVYLFVCEITHDVSSIG